MGKKGEIKVGQFADLIVPDRDYFACAESEIADTTSDLTIVGGKVVYAEGNFHHLDETMPPPAMPDWSPVRRYGGYAAWGQTRESKTLQRTMAAVCGCATSCGVHGHEHASAWSSSIPAADLRAFWGALGCACWAV